MKFEIKKPEKKSEAHLGEKTQQVVKNVAKEQQQPKKMLPKKKIIKQDPLAMTDEQFEQVIQKLKQKKKPEVEQKEVVVVEPERPKTEDGLAIYSADELKIGQKGSGRTKLCPFDCDCCY